MTIRQLEQLMIQYGKDILSFCIHLSGNESEGEELYQEVLLKAMDKLSSIHADDNPKSYLLGMAMKLFLSEKRKKARRDKIIPLSGYDEFPEYAIVSQENPGTTEEIFMENEEKRIVQRAVQELPDKYKTVVLLFYMEELSLAEIANLLHIPKGTAASRLHKAKELLRHRLEKVL